MLTVVLPVENLKNFQSCHAQIRRNKPMDLKKKTRVGSGVDLT